MFMQIKEKNMKKQKLVMIILALIAVVGITIGVYFLTQKNESKKELDAQKFKTEYESINGEKNASNKTYTTLNIDGENPMIYADYDKIFDVLEGTGVIFFGFKECPWCRTAIPVLLEAAEEVGIDKIYYLNNKEDRDTKSLVDGKVVTEKEGSDNYYKLLDKLGTEYTREYTGLNDDSIRRLYYPTVLVVKDGKIISSIVGTVDSQEDPYVALTEDQKTELKNTYIDTMKKTILCDQSC